MICSACGAIMRRMIFEYWPSTSKEPAKTREVWVDASGHQENVSTVNWEKAG